MEDFIEFKITGIEPISTNDMYFAVPMKSKKNPNRMWATTARTPALKEYQRVLQDKLSVIKTENSELVDYMTEKVASKYYKINSKYVIRTSNKQFYLTQDSSNCVKALEDCIVKYLFNKKIDDNVVNRLVVEKIYSPVVEDFEITCQWELAHRSYYEYEIIGLPLYCQNCDEYHSVVTQDSVIKCKECGKILVDYSTEV